MQYNPSPRFTVMLFFINTGQREFCSFIVAFCQFIPDHFFLPHTLTSWWAIPHPLPLSLILAQVCPTLHASLFIQLTQFSTDRLNHHVLETQHLFYQHSLLIYVWRKLRTSSASAVAPEKERCIRPAGCWSKGVWFQMAGCWEHSVDHSTAKWTTMETRRDTGVPTTNPVCDRASLFVHVGSSYTHVNELVVNKAGIHAFLMCVCVNYLFLMRVFVLALWYWLTCTLVALYLHPCVVPSGQ